MTNIPNNILIAALAGFKLERQRIDDQIASVEAMLGGKTKSPTITPNGSTGGRKKISAASRKKMAAAQKARWAKLKGESEPARSAALEAPKPKRQISPEGIKRIIAAQKARWRQQKASAKTESGSAAKTARKAARKSAHPKAA